MGQQKQNGTESIESIGTIREILIGEYVREFEEKMNAMGAEINNLKKEIGELKKENAQLREMQIEDAKKMASMIEETSSSLETKLEENIESVSKKVEKSSSNEKEFLSNFLMDMAKQIGGLATGK